MIKKITCIECPRSCSLSIDIENCRVIKVSDSKCPKGEEYAKTEVENPLRILTGTVLTEGLSLKMVPVKTDCPIPKNKISEAAVVLKKIKLTTPLSLGSVIVADFLGLKVNLITTRDL